MSPLGIMIRSVMIYEHVEIPNIHCTKVIFFFNFLNGKAMHSILGSWQILNVKERKDKTFAFETESPCFLKVFYPCVQLLKYLYLADLSSPNVTGTWGKSSC